MPFVNLIAHRENVLPRSIVLAGSKVDGGSKSLTAEVDVDLGELFTIGREIAPQHTFAAEASALPAKRKATRRRKLVTYLLILEIGFTLMIFLPFII